MFEFLTELFVERAGGPMKLRLLLQPIMATIFAIRAGLKDAKFGRPPFLWTVVHDPAQRAALLKQGWGDVAKVFVIAGVLDTVYQVVNKTGVRLVESLVVAVILAIVPYLILRGPITRIAARMKKKP